MIRNVFAPQRDLLSHDAPPPARAPEREDPVVVSSLHDVSVRRALVRLIARDVEVRALIQEERERPHGQTEHLWRVVALFLAIFAAAANNLLTIAHTMPTCAMREFPVTSRSGNSPLNESAFVTGFTGATSAYFERMVAIRDDSRNRER